MKNLELTPIEQVLRNSNSTINQNIKSKFVSQHVYCNVNSMVQYILNKGFEDSTTPFSFDDVSNYSVYPEYIGEYANFEGGKDEQRDAEIDRLKDLQSDLYDEIQDLPNNNDAHDVDRLSLSLETKRDTIQSEIVNLENLEQEYQDIFEWWAVSDFLAEKLNNLGHCIIESENIWGRTTTGQAILLDYAISQICAEMEILEGQKNSWA